MVRASRSSSDKTPTFATNQPAVLLVDDEPRFRDEVRTLVEAGGGRCLEASTGDEALDIISDSAISVMVTDLVMPGLNGFELLRLLHRRSNTSFRKIAVTDKYAIDVSLKDLLSS